MPWAPSSSRTRASSLSAASERRLRTSPPAASRISGPPRRAGNRHGALADEGDDVPARVRELEQAASLVDAKAEVEHVHVLDQRRDDVTVAPSPHLAEKRFLRLAEDLGLVREQVAKSWDASELGRPLTGLGEETSGPRPADLRQPSSSSSSTSPSASSEKSIASPSSSIACIPSSISSPAGSSASATPSSSSSANTSTSRASKLSLAYGRNSTSRLRRIGKLGLPAKRGSW